MADTTEKFDQWALVEVMGHRRFAGRVTEQVVAGQGYVRVDVPPVGDRLAFSKLIGPGSIYCITPVSEEVARRLAEQYHERPVDVYTPSVQHALPYHNHGEDDDEVEDDGEEGFT
jgi:hypothetical protein